MTVDELNARHGTRFALAGAYAGGEVGAQRLVDDRGAHFVLKLQSPGLAPQTTEALTVEQTSAEEARALARAGSKS